MADVATVSQTYARETIMILLSKQATFESKMRHYE